MERLLIWKYIWYHSFCVMLYVAVWIGGDIIDSDDELCVELQPARMCVV